MLAVWEFLLHYSWKSPYYSGVIPDLFSYLYFCIFCLSLFVTLFRVTIISKSLFNFNVSLFFSALWTCSTICIITRLDNYWIHSCLYSKIQLLLLLDGAHVVYTVWCVSVRVCVIVISHRQTTSNRNVLSIIHTSWSSIILYCMCTHFVVYFF